MSSGRDPLRHYRASPLWAETIITDGVYTSEAFDLQDAPGTVMASILAGPCTAGATAFKVQERASALEAWADVADADIENLTIGATGFYSTGPLVSLVQRVRFNTADRLRFVRFVATHAGGGFDAIGGLVFRPCDNTVPALPVGVF